jgi:hypothetical protein
MSNRFHRLKRDASSTYTTSKFYSENNLQYEEQAIEGEEDEDMAKVV